MSTLTQEAAIPRSDSAYKTDEEIEIENSIQKINSILQNDDLTSNNIEDYYSSIIELVKVQLGDTNPDDTLDTLYQKVIESFEKEDIEDDPSEVKKYMVLIEYLSEKYDRYYRDEEINVTNLEEGHKVYTGLDTKNGCEVAWHEVDYTVYNQQYVTKYNRITDNVNDNGILVLLDAWLYEDQKGIKSPDSSQKNMKIIYVTEKVVLNVYDYLYSNTRLTEVVLFKWLNQLLVSLSKLIYYDTENNNYSVIYHRNISCLQINIQQSTGVCKLGGLGCSCVSALDRSILPTRNPRIHYFYPNIAQYNDAGYITNLESRELPSVQDDLYALGVCILFISLTSSVIPQDYAKTNSVGGDKFDLVSPNKIRSTVEQVTDSKLREILTDLLFPPYKYTHTSINDLLLRLNPQYKVIVPDAEVKESFDLLFSRFHIASNIKDVNNLNIILTLPAVKDENINYKMDFVFHKQNDTPEKVIDELVQQRTSIRTTFASPPLLDDEFLDYVKKAIQEELSAYI